MTFNAKITSYHSIGRIEKKEGKVKTCIKGPAMQKTTKHNKHHNQPRISGRRRPTVQGCNCKRSPN